MLTFREFYDICEGKKPGTAPQAVPGTYKRDSDGTVSYTLQRYDGPVGKPTKKEVDKLVVKRSGGKKVEKELKRRADKIKKIKEDINQQSTSKDPNEVRREAARRRAEETKKRLKEKQKQYSERQQQLKKQREEEMKQRIALRKLQSI